MAACKTAGRNRFPEILFPYCRDVRRTRDNSNRMRFVFHSRLAKSIGPWPVVVISNLDRNESFFVCVVVVVVVVVLTLWEAC